MASRRRPAPRASIIGPTIRCTQAEAPDRCAEAGSIRAEPVGRPLRRPVRLHERVRDEPEASLTQARGSSPAKPRRRWTRGLYLASAVHDCGHLSPPPPLRPRRCHDVVSGRRRDRRMPQLATDDVQPHAGCKREFRVGMPRPCSPIGVTPASAPAPAPEPLGSRAPPPRADPRPGRP